MAIIVILTNIAFTLGVCVCVLLPSRDFILKETGASRNEQQKIKATLHKTF